MIALTHMLLKMPLETFQNLFLICVALQSELGNFAQSSTLLRQSFYPKFQTMFQPCNLKGALQLVEDFHAQVQVDCSPRKAAKKSGMFVRGEVRGGCLEWESHAAEMR